MASSSDDRVTNKKREHLRQLEKLKREATKAERECRLHSSTFHHRYNNNNDENSRDHGEGLSSLDVELKRFSTDRESELKRLCQRLTEAKVGVRKFKDVVIKSQQKLPASPQTVEELRSKMVDIESSISAFKAKQKAIYDDLIRDELQCVNEIASLDKKMAAWERQKPLSARSTAGRGDAAIARLFPGAGGVDAVADLPPAVLAFEKFQQQSGGSCGGWNEEDHAIFMRIRQKHKGKSSLFIEEAAPLLAPRSSDDILRHEEWFREHDRLLEAKRAAIEEWRKSKLVKQKEGCDSYRENEQAEKDRLRRMEMERREKAELDKIKKEAEVAAWKRAREEEKARETDKKVAEEEEAKRKAEVEAARKAKLKIKADEFARAKEEAARELREAEARADRIEREKKRKTAAEEILKFQERDQMTVAQRIVFNQRRAAEEIEKARRLEKMKENVSVERDPERLVRPTKGMEERRRAKEKEEEEERNRFVKGERNGASFNVRQIQHRATPSWRTGV